MFCTRNYSIDIKEVPIIWTFSYYGNIPVEQFNGDQFKIKSIFNTADNTPSLSFYLAQEGRVKKYRFNDFSTGYKGSHIDFVMCKYGINYHAACIKIVNEYNDWLSKGGVYEEGNVVPKGKYKVTDYKIRKWTNLDALFWTKFNIGSRLLERYNVKPLSYYTMYREDNTFTVEGDHIYGYFTNDGLLYKIYQPYSSQKFIKICDYLQGSDQVKGNLFLIYLASLKDLMSFESLELKMDSKAPDSENTLISPDEVEKDKKNYRKILVLFDNDDAGIKSANLYKEKYDIEPVFLNYGEKDLSDHFNKFGPQKVSRWLIPLIHKKIN